MEQPDRLLEAVAVLALMQRYCDELPAPEPLLELKGTRRRALCNALDLALASDNLPTPQLAERAMKIMEQLDKALPDGWPASAMMFVSHFWACAQGQVPVIARHDTATGAVELERLTDKVAMH